ncbi:MAG TPA: hypothetical protein VKG80_14985 [Trebonia sp.]|nr:hypothetical protein [Trebonia sp.]
MTAPDRAARAVNDATYVAGAALIAATEGREGDFTALFGCHPGDDRIAAAALVLACWLGYALRGTSPSGNPIPHQDPGEFARRQIRRAAEAEAAG